MNWPAAKTAPTHLGDIEYRDVGEGPAIVFLHLVLAEASHWDKMPELLADRYRCVFPTLPMGAHRLPARVDADLSVDGLARAVVDLIHHLDLDAVTLVGNDSGGAISQVIAANHREVLDRVVLTNCDMYDDFPPKLFSYFNLLPHIPGGFKMAGHALKVRAFWGLPFVFGRLANVVDPTKIDRWADALLADVRVREDARKVMLGFGPEVTNQAAEQLRETDLPILVAWGEDDRAFRPTLAKRFVAEVASANLVLIENCKTFVCWDQPHKLAELISEFIQPSS
ncbi:MAG: alpha/beta hydrolase [Pseudomonadota bacterium]